MFLCADSTVAVFGLGAVGLAVIEAAKLKGAKKIYAIDTNPAKAQVARKFGATDFVNPRDFTGQKIQVCLVLFVLYFYRVTLTTLGRLVI